MQFSDSKAVDYHHIFYPAHPEWVKTFKRRRVHLNAWVVNDEEKMDWFLKHKFDYITTDYPAKLLRKVATPARLRQRTADSGNMVAEVRSVSTK